MSALGGCLVPGGQLLGGAWSRGGVCSGAPGPGGGVPGPGGPGPGGCLVPGGLLWGGGIPACTEADPPPRQMATVADGTHPTGMHSC